MLSSIVPIIPAQASSQGEPVQSEDLPPRLELLVDDWQPEEVTGEHMIAALATIGIALMLGFLISRLTRFAIRRWTAAPQFASVLAGRVAGYFVVLIGVIVALESIGLTLGPMVIIVTCVVLAVWVMRPLLQNMGAGLMLQARGPFQPGEQIQSHGFEGVVEELDARVLQIRTLDGRRIYIPNSDLADSPIINLTELGARRSSFDVGVAYFTDLDAAVEVVKAALLNTPGVFDDPPPEAFVHEFDDSNVKIAAWFWHEPDIHESWRVKDEAARAVFRALRNAGIEISFPRRTLAWAE